MQLQLIRRGLQRGRKTLAGPDCTPEQLDRLVEIRIGRQHVLTDERVEVPPVQLHAVLDEAALHRGMDQQIIRDQLADLVRRSRWSNVRLQVVPFDAGFNRANGTFAIFEPRDASDREVVNVESTGQDAYFDTPAEVAKYREIWADVLRDALSPEASRDFHRADGAGTVASAAEPVTRGRARHCAPRPRRQTTRLR